MTDDIENGSKTGKWRMSPLAWRLLILLFVVALLVFDVTRPPSPESWSWVWIGKKLWKMPGGIGALLGTGIGLSVGFKTLIAAQEHQADLARKARKAQFDEDRKMLAAGLHAELDAIVRIGKAHVAFLKGTGPKIALAAAMRSQIGIVPPKVVLDPTPIIECGFYKANAGRLGLLGANLAADVIMIYEMTSYWRRRAEGAEPFDAGNYKDVISNIVRNLDSTFPKIWEVIRRLEAIEQGLPDPGEGPAVAANKTDD